MLSNKEIRLWKIWQFFDKHSFFPFEKVRINITLNGDLVAKLKEIENKSKFIENSIRNQPYLKK